jgi:hypothetical protein
MPRTTISDRARKARIRAREAIQMRKQLEKLETITQEQIAVLRKLDEALENGEPLTTAAVPEWRDLYAMGVVRAEGDMLLVTSVGMDVLDSEEEA